MKIYNIEVFGFEAAIRGMRNPRDSQDRSDSSFWWPYMARLTPWELYDISAPECPRIGSDDLRLMKTLLKQGNSHAKFARQIHVWFDLTMPVFSWIDFDTYKIATVKNCQSSSHVLKQGPVKASAFDEDIDPRMVEIVNEYAAAYMANPNAENYHKLRCNLPQGFEQTATFEMNYAVAIGVYRDRARHILPEFSGPGGICEMISRLPYMRELIE